MEEATLLSSEGRKVGTYVILSKKSSPPLTRHDVGEDIVFPGAFLEAELAGEIPVHEEGPFTLLAKSFETRVRVKTCHPLPEGSAFFQIRVCAA